MRTVAKILNFGSLNIDDVYDVEHFVKAGETISSRALSLFCGGKGHNQSVALARAGAEVYHAGLIGPDGLMLKQSLEESGAHTDYIRVSDGKTGHAIIQVEPSGQNCILLYSGTNRMIDKDFVHEVMDAFGAGDILLLQNEISCLDEIIRIGRDKGMQIVLNPSPMDDLVLALPLEEIDMFILNEIEGAELTGCSAWSGILDSMSQRYPRAAIVLTLGKDGAVCRQGEQTATCGIYQMKPVDTTAAGDTFTGYFLSSLLDGNSPEKALHTAALAAALAVGTKGAASSVPWKCQVEQAQLEYIPFQG